MVTRSDALHALRIAGPAPLAPDAALWRRAAEQRLALSPAPVAMAAGVSPYLARSSGHGRVGELRVCMLHDGEALAIRLAWPDASANDGSPDLDTFADAVAVMFPLAPGAEALTMGSAESPVDLWLWKADHAEPFDAVARGWGTTRKRAGGASGLEARALRTPGGWSLVFRRALAAPGAEQVALVPGATTRLAFAVWDGGNAERAGQKAISAGFLPAVLDP